MSTGPTGPDTQPSLVRTGAKAGLAFAGSVIKGGLLGVVLGGGVFFFYLSQLNGPGNVAARAGGAGAIIALITTPSVLVALLLLLFVVVYTMLGVAQGRARPASASGSAPRRRWRPCPGCPAAPPAPRGGALRWRTRGSPACWCR
jgi:hypothetical protein